MSESPTPEPLHPLAEAIVAAAAKADARHTLTPAEADLLRRRTDRRRTAAHRTLRTATRRKPAAPPAGPIALFNSPGHQKAAGGIPLQLDGSSQTTDVALFTLDNPTTTVSYAQLVSLAGDYFAGTSRVQMTRSISNQTSDDDKATVFQDKVASLQQQRVLVLGSDQPVTDLLNGIAIEAAALVSAHAVNGNESWMAYFQPYQDTGYDLADYLDYDVAIAAVSKVGYALISAFNLDHFGANAIDAYTAGHGVALQLAQDATSEEDLLAAYLANAYADHFLTDLFSAGHMRVPRNAIPALITAADVAASSALSTYLFYLAGFLVKYMHDEDSALGLNVTNANGDTWTLFGDKRAYDDCNATNLAMANRAVAASVAEVYAAYTGSPPTHYAALDYVPDLSTVTSFVPGHQPMFKLHDNKVYARAQITDILCDSWVELTYNTISATSRALDGYTTFGLTWTTGGPPNSGYIASASNSWGGPSVQAVTGGASPFLAVAWCQASRGHDTEVYHASLDSNGDWLSLQQIPVLSTYELRPSLVGYNNAVLAFCGDSSYASFQVASTPSPSSLPIPQNVWTVLGTDFPASCKYGGPVPCELDGALYVAWCEHSTPGGVSADTTVSIALWSSNTLGTPVNLPWAYTREQPPALAAFDGALWMAWRDYKVRGGAAAISYASSTTPTDAGSWTAPATIAAAGGVPFDNATTAYGPALAEFQGDLWAAWVGPDDAIYVSKMVVLEGDETDPESATDDVTTTCSWSPPLAVPGATSNGTPPALAAFDDMLCLLFTNGSGQVCYLYGQVTDPTAAEGD